MLILQKIKTLGLTSLVVSSVIACSTGIQSAPSRQDMTTTAPVLDGATFLTWDALNEAQVSIDEIELDVSFQPQLDLTQRIREGFQMPSQVQNETANKRIKPELNWYASHPKYMERVFERSRRYMFHIVEEIEERGLPSELALLPIVESAFDPFAYSHGRAAGLWQFIPGTGRRFGLKQNWWYDGRRDVVAATTAALDYLEYLVNDFDGDWLLAVAAYNSGEGTVRRAVRRNKRSNKPTDFWNLRLPRETRAYVPKLIALKRLVEDPAALEVRLPFVANIPYFEIVDTQSQLDLGVASAWAQVSIDEIYALNPGFNRWATDPKGPHRLLIPKANAQAFRESLAESPVSQRMQWKRHKIKSGESLGLIAEKYGTTVSVLKQANNLSSSRIRAGRHLMIPTATKSLSAYTKSADARLSATQNRRRKGTKVSHQVTSGESFWTISRKYGVGMRQLAQWNGMAPRDTLSVGRKLVVWQSEGTVSAAVPSTGRTRKINYTVRRGDSLSTIANRFRVSVGQLKRWNQSAKQNKYLQPGQRLVLYVDVTKQSG
ncbi:MAG: LysM peptidoglycan-binding domain-containing protein [Pseudomonadota bacterium]